MSGAPITVGSEKFESWRLPSFRANIQSKIEDAIRHSGNPTSKSFREMEMHIFQKAKTREEYLGYAARLIIHIREKNPSRSSGNENSSQRNDSHPIPQVHGQNSNLTSPVRLNTPIQAPTVPHISHIIPQVRGQNSNVLVNPPIQTPTASHMSHTTPQMHGHGSNLISPILVNPPIQTPTVPHMSPSSAVNSAVSAGPTQALLNVNSDEKYFEKVRLLSKYVEPLKQLIKCLDKDISKKQQVNHLGRILSILTTPNKVYSMDILNKCEQELQNLIPIEAPPKAPTVAEKPKEVDCCQELIDTLHKLKRSPMLNDILHRVFLPPMTALFGNSIRECYSPPPKRRKCEEESPEIPDILQGEIARLDQKFKVQFDPVHHLGSKIVNLVCQLDDKNLPCVPPIHITVPANYPDYPPRCSISEEEYKSTPTLINIQKVFCAKISAMPEKYSITSLLDTWEMSVRQACGTIQKSIC